MSARILWRNLAVITVIIILEVTSAPVHQIISSMRIRKHVEVRDLHEVWSSELLYMEDLLHPPSQSVVTGIF